MPLCAALHGFYEGTDLTSSLGTWSQCVLVYQSMAYLCIVFGRGTPAVICTGPISTGASLPCKHIHQHLPPTHTHTHPSPSPPFRPLIFTGDELRAARSPTYDCFELVSFYFSAKKAPPRFYAYSSSSGVDAHK